MSIRTKTPWARDLDVVQELLGPVYAEARIAGSLRRGKAEVGDVEIVLAPLYDGAANLLDQRFEQLLGSQVEKRLIVVDGKPQVQAWGQSGKESRYKALSFRGVSVDVLIVLPLDRQWGPTLAIRTGLGDANKQLVATVPYGVLPKGREFDEGGVKGDGVTLDTPDELSVFAACGLPWLAPPLRSVAGYREIAAYPRAFSPRLRGTILCEIPLAGWRPREDATWKPNGSCLFLDSALARPARRVGEARPAVQQPMFA